MTLVDTSVWIAHLRSADSQLVELLAHDEVLLHPYVLGEIALGTMAERVRVLTHLGEQPVAPVVSPAELLRLIQAYALYGRGIGYVDAHLLASARLCGAVLWTLDQRLIAAARDLGLEAPAVQ